MTHFFPSWRFPCCSLVGWGVSRTQACLGRWERPRPRPGSALMTPSARSATLTRRKSCRFRSREQHPIISKLGPLNCPAHTGHRTGSDVKLCLKHGDGSSVVPVQRAAEELEEEVTSASTHLTCVVFCDRFRWAVLSDPNTALLLCYSTLQVQVELVGWWHHFLLLTLNTNINRETSGSDFIFVYYTES